MFAYIICLISICFFTGIAESCFKSNKKYCGIFCLFMVILIFSFFAGIRADDVGRDMGFYVTNIFERAQKYDFGRYFEICNETSVESGYCIFVYLISLITSDYHVLLFMIQFLTCTSVMYFGYKMKPNINLFTFVLIYFFTLYLKSYTIMRQSMAVGFVMVSIILFKEKSYLKCGLFFVLAYYFHNSAIVALSIYCIMYICNSNKLNNKSKNILLFSIIVVAMIICLFYKNIIYIFTYNIAILPVKFYNYLNGAFYSNSIEIVKTDAILKIICILISVCVFIKDRKKITENKVFFLLLILDFLLFIISFRMTNISRIGYYYFYPALLYVLSRVEIVLAKKLVNRMGFFVIVMSIVGGFWFYTYPIKKDCETFPYRTNICEFLN